MVITINCYVGPQRHRASEAERNTKCSLEIKRTIRKLNVTTQALAKKRGYNC